MIFIRRKKTIILLLLFVCSVVKCYTQSASDSIKSPFQLELNGHAGKLIKVHGEYPKNKTTTLIELNLSWKLLNQNSWHYNYNYPSAGISFVHAQFGNQDILGQAVGIIPCMRFEKWRGNTRWSWRAGLGIAGFNKPYDAQENPKNLVIGSQFTNMSLLRIEFSKPLCKTLRYSLGISLMHCSDAHIAVPNVGANLVAFSAGISFCKYPDLIKTESERPKQDVIKNSWNLNVQSLFGVHEFSGTTRPTDGPRYFVYGESIAWSRRMRPGRRFALGVNHYYYTAYLEYAKSQELFADRGDLKSIAHTFIIYSGYEWRYGPFDLFVQAGINVYNPFNRALNQVWDLPKHGSLYLLTSNKIGYRWRPFSSNKKEMHRVDPSISIAVKTNGGTADFLEFGLCLDIFSAKKSMHTLKN
jgi:hypothetical protein